MSDGFGDIIAEWMKYPSDEGPQEWMARQIISLRGSLAQQQEQAVHAATFAELHAKVEEQLRQRIAELEAGLATLLYAYDHATTGDLHHHACVLWSRTYSDIEPGCRCTCGADSAVEQARKLLPAGPGEVGE